VTADAGHELGDVGAERATRAGHAGERDAVDEPTRPRRKTGEALVGCRRRVEVDPGEPFGIEGGVELGRLLPGEIGYANPGSPPRYLRKGFA
jgi:hypothetical protein